MVPGSGSGDKVPLHLGGRLAAMVEPGELVSVANRNATAALMGVNSAVPRFAGGGILNTQEMADLWRSKGGSASLADTMGVIGLVESGGNPHARNPSGASGPVADPRPARPRQPLQPAASTPSTRSRSTRRRTCTRGTRPGRSGGRCSAIAGAFGGVGDSTEKFSNMISMASHIDAMDIPYGAQGHGGWGLNQLGEDCSSSVSKVLHAAGYLSSVLTTVGLPGALDKGSGKMVTVHDRALPGNAGHTIIQLGNKFWGTSSQNPGGGPGWLSTPSSAYLASLPTKLHPKGMAKGGLPFLGSYHNGGIARREGIAHVAAGERMTPAGRGGPLVNIEHAEFKQGIDVNSFAAHIGFKIATA
jgi:hypothetical protein